MLSSEGINLWPGQSIRSRPFDHPDQELSIQQETCTLWIHAHLELGHTYNQLSSNR